MSRLEMTSRLCQQVFPSCWRGLISTLPTQSSDEKRSLMGDYSTRGG